MNRNHEDDELQKINTDTPDAGQTEPKEAEPEKAEQPVAAEETKPEQKPKQHKFKEYTASARFRHGSISTAFTVGFIVVVILVNVIVGILGEKFPSMNLDLTKSSTNTLSTQALEVVKNVKSPVTMYIIATEEQTKNDQILSSYGIQYSQVGILAAKMAEKNSNIKVEYINLTKDPTFASKYKDQNLQEGDVLFVSDKRNRLLAYTDLFDVQTTQEGTSNTFSKVDSGLASGLNSVISENMPIVAFDTGHSEKLDATSYKSLLTNNSFETKDFSLLTDAIPDKTQMVVLGCPFTDYTEAEIKKLDSFLSSTKIAGDRSLLITFHPSQQTMPVLSSFLKEWGIEVPSGQIIVETDQTKYLSGDQSYILSTPQTTLSLGGKSDYGYFTTPQSNPVNILFDTQGTKKTYSLVKSNATCYLESSSQKGNTSNKKAFDTAALSQDSVQSGDKTYKANVIALGSTIMFSSEILAASNFGNASYLVDLSKYVTGTSNTATAITSTQVQTNVSDITLSTGASTLLGFGVFTLLIPLLIAIAGILVYHKRRHL